MRLVSLHSQQFSEKLIAKLDLAYVFLDHSMRVVSLSDNLPEFGFPDIQVGSHITDSIDFMVGITADADLELTVLKSPSDQAISVNLWPEKDGLNMLISDASKPYQQHQILQQKANENELLLEKQKKLMLQLEDAQGQLQVRNTQLENASRLQSSFLSGVSHEFRTPLTSIIGYTDLLNRHTDMFAAQLPESPNYLSAIRRSSNHLLSLVENLLDHGKLDSGEIMVNPKQTDLIELLDDVFIVLEPLAVEKNIKFDFVHNFSAPANALIDASRLRQCLINVIGNAIKFTDIGSVNVEALWQDDQLAIVVTDTGIGIDADDLQQIYQPFWQVADTGKEGAGLGLTITQRILGLMGGEISIDSSKGQGTSVELQLLIPRLDHVDETHADKQVSISKELHFLLVEDDDDIAELVLLLLHERGVQVTRVENGALAVDIVNKIDFDMILMDIHMPVLDGYEAVELIRGGGNKTPIVVMSASPLEAEPGRAEQLGCDGYLVKPVDVGDILNLANELI